MLHTSLHRALGENPGDLTDQMIDDAVAQGIEEADDLDWKKTLPAEKDFRDSDIVKDIAAFANAGGGVIVFGVTETNRAATGRNDAGELSEGYERTIRKVSMAAITPPVFGVQAFVIPSTTGTRAVALVIPASPDAPHLVFRNDTFGAPLRTGADTLWMNERQLEMAYRSRFDGARRGEEALQQLYEDMAAAVGADEHAVLVGAARPRTRRPRVEPRHEVTSVFYQASMVARWWLSGNSPYGPLEDVNLYQARPAMDGHYLPPKDPGDYREAHAAIYDNGSIGLSWRAGGHMHEHTGKPYGPHQIPTIAIEGFAAALIALVHAVASETSVGDYEIFLGVELNSADGKRPEFLERNAAPPAGVHRTISGRFRPLHTIVDPSANDTTFIRAAVDIATSALNQIGIKKPTILDTMLPPRPRDWTW
ncbi:helix-turn-helix domain-containing protein [Microbacterium sp. PAMC22086]|uniref:AlbA family DNA-binding domain-containing protein n=1 Tax=Microbacterium sp. PAMC22086 TaxID=2861281 RepID=UPI001C62D0E4|nr:ATP-binding protein [Microbacterium sp. PAMC22086]QYG11380.1 ATP-binding protein [Microbacterium sp. PAMC22086]